MLLGGSDIHEPQQQQMLEPVEIEHDHGGHFAWFHEHTMEAGVTLVVAACGLLGTWLMVRGKRRAKRET